MPERNRLPIIRWPCRSIGIRIQAAHQEGCIAGMFSGEVEHNMLKHERLITVKKLLALSLLCGLALVKHIANRHGGRLTIESTLGQGATFTVHLPALRSWR